MSATQKTVEVQVRKSNRGAFVLMFKFDETNTQAKSYILEKFAPILKKIAREPDFIEGFTREGDVKHLWICWFIVEKSIVESILKHISYVPVTGADFIFKIHNTN